MISWKLATKKITQKKTRRSDEERQWESRRSSEIKEGIR